MRIKSIVRPGTRRRIRRLLLKQELKNREISIVVYDTYTGSTEKIARHIAAGLQCDAITADKAEDIALGVYDLVVMGTPVHFFGPTRKILRLIRINRPRNMALFCTFGIMGHAHTLKKMASISKRSTIIDTFEEIGQCAIIPNTRGKPYREDLQRAREFGEKLNRQLDQFVIGPGKQIGPAGPGTGQTKTG